MRAAPLREVPREKKSNGARHTRANKTITHLHVVAQSAAVVMAVSEDVQIVVVRVLRVPPLGALGESPDVRSEGGCHDRG